MKSIFKFLFLSVFIIFAFNQNIRTIEAYIPPYGCSSWSVEESCNIPPLFDTNIYADPDPVDDSVTFHVFGVAAQTITWCTRITSYKSDLRYVRNDEVEIIDSDIPSLVGQTISVSYDEGDLGECVGSPLPGGGPAQSWTPGRATEFTGQASFDSRSFSNGEHYIRVEAVDNWLNNSSDYPISFTVSHEEIFYGCTDSNASNFDFPADTTHQDDGSCIYPGDSDPNGSNPPADFSINGQCDLWPNPEVEISFSPVSGATNYKLQKWHIYYYYDLYSGTYDYVNRRTDPVEDGETAYYRVVAENDNGSTSSNEYEQVVNQANCGGGAIALTTSVSAGSGSISGTGISCPGDCSEYFDYGDWVTLTATPASGYAFSGWTGACAGQGASCSVYMDSSKSTAVSFSSNSYTLSVAKAGSGGGSVGSDPGGIGCGPTCSAIFSYGTVVSLYPTAQTDSDFTGWSGACAGAGLGVCNLSISGNMEAVANFDATPFNYSLSNSGTSSVTKSSGNAYTQNVIDKNLISGSAQSVSLSLSGVPDGVSYSIADSTCAPNCSSTITFTVSPSAPTGSYTITVTGSPLNKTTSFTLSITGSPITVSCSASPTTALLGEPVLWSASVVGGVAPLSYSWSGTNFPTPAPDSATYSKTYTTVGQKVAQLTVTDDNGTSATCPAVTIQINFNPDFTEF